jgi:ABC-type transport system involved in multi-copper enzyme maturation permease subunit
MNPIRIWAIAFNVFRETIRDRVLYLIGLFAVILVAAGPFLYQVSNGAENKILLDLGLAAIHFFGLVVAVFVGAGLVNKEIDKRTVFILVSKPLSRAEFMLGKHLGLGSVLALMLVLLTGVYGAVLVVQQIPSIPWDPIFWAIVFTLLELLLLVAAALLFGSFTSTLLATLYTIALYFVGHFSRSLLELGSITKNPVVGQLSQLFYLVLPDLERLNLKNDAVYGFLPDWSDLLASGAYGIFYTILLLSVAIGVFARRQF